MASLYELTQDAAALQDLLESGEIDEQTFYDTLEAMDVGTKLENICKMIRNLDAKAAAFKTEKDRMAAKEKAAVNAVARLKDSLLAYMFAMDKKKVDAGLFTISKSSSKSVEIEYEDMLDTKYFIPQPDKIDKAAIKEDIKAGLEVTGARLVEKPFVSIR